MINAKNTNPILKGLSNVMKREGFKKRSNNWYLNTDETILTVNIQSDLNSKYINFGIWVKRLANKEYLDRFKEYKIALNEEFPRYFQCHIYFRPVHFPMEIKSIAREVFNLSSELISNEEREKYIIEWMNAYELPILKQCSTIPGIVKALNNGKFKGALIKKEIKMLIISCLLSLLKNLIAKKIGMSVKAR